MLRKAIEGRVAAGQREDMDTQGSAAGCVCLWGSAFKECQSAESPRVPAKSNVFPYPKPTDK